MNPTKLAVIGAGLIGQRHLELIQANPECRLVAVCDPHPSAVAIAERHGVPHYPEYRSLLDECNLDGAIIATPTDLHTDIGIACLECGLHILVEKPIAATVVDAQRMNDAAKSYGVEILVGHHRRHYPLVQRARELVKSGSIGKLVTVSAHFLLKKPDDYFAGAEWRTLRPGGGPALINLIHDIDNLRFICGDVQQVYAQMSSAIRSFEVEDAVSINLTFANGALGVILGADATPSPWSYELTSGENQIYPNYLENCYYFCGTEGSFAFPQMSLWRYANTARAGWHEPLELVQNPVPQELKYQPNPLAIQIEHFCQVIRGAQEPLVSGADATKSLAVVLAILESADRDEPILLYDQSEM